MIGATRLKSAVFDELHHTTSSASASSAASSRLARDKEAGYQRRIMELESQVYPRIIMVANTASLCVVNRCNVQ